MDKGLFRLILRTALCLLLVEPVFATALVACTDVFADKGELRPILLDRSEVEPFGESFVANSFYNAALLREMFTPNKNDFKNWLKWLESDERAPAPLGIEIYHDSRPGGFVIGKRAKFPIDMGVDQLGLAFGDDSPRLMELMYFDSPGSTHFKGSDPTAQKARKDLLRYLDTQLFGIYGAMNKDTYNELVLRTSVGADLTLQASVYPGMKLRSTHTFRSYFPPKATVPSNPLGDFKKIASVIHQDDSTVTVKVDLSRTPENENQEVIRQMFFITHWQMVQKSYRESNLFPDNFETAVMLLDDFIKTMESSGGKQEVYLMYERSAWESMQFRMNLAHQYVSVKLSGVDNYQPFRYQTISDVFTPLYPIYGLVLERHPNGKHELKRLFSNHNPDPLRVLPGEFVLEKSWNLEFYKYIAEQLDPGTSLMVVSKTPIHTRLYKGIGFDLTSSVFYPDWNSNKDTLEGSRENFIERLTQRIQIQKGNPGGD